MAQIKLLIAIGLVNFCLYCKVNKYKLATTQNVNLSIYSEGQIQNLFVTNGGARYKRKCQESDSYPGPLNKKTYCFFLAMNNGRRAQWSRTQDIQIEKNDPNHCAILYHPHPSGFYPC